MVGCADEIFVTSISQQYVCMCEYKYIYFLHNFWKTAKFILTISGLFFHTTQFQSHILVKPTFTHICKHSDNSNNTHTGVDKKIYTKDCVFFFCIRIFYKTK